MKAFEVEVRIRNNRLKQHRLTFGFATQRALAEAVNLSINTITKYETMTLTPLSANGGWKDSALKLAEFFGVGPDYLFPPETHAPRATSMVRQLDAADVPVLLGTYSSQLESPEAAAIRCEQSQRVQDAVSELPDQKRTALTLRFGLGGCGEHTLDQVGERLGKSRERAAQVIRGALRDLHTIQNEQLLFGENSRCKLCGKAILRRRSRRLNGFCWGCYLISRRRRTMEGNTHDDQLRRKT